MFSCNPENLVAKLSCLIPNSHSGNRSRTLTTVTSSGKDSDPPATHNGPSWGLMLALILLAMLVALGFAWLFIHNLMRPH